MTFLWLLMSLLEREIYCEIGSFMDVFKEGQNRLIELIDQENKFINGSNVLLSFKGSVNRIGKGSVTSQLGKFTMFNYTLVLR